MIHNDQNSLIKYKQMCYLLSHFPFICLNFNSIIKYHFSTYNKMLNSYMDKKHNQMAHKIISSVPILGYVFKGSQLLTSHSVSEIK